MSHKGAGAPTNTPSTSASNTIASTAIANSPAAASNIEGSRWTASGEAELARIPFFVRGKVKRNTEAFAQEKGLSEITDEILYEAKAHFSR
jgi:light-independent protochlorophyllide reductase subunit B